MTGQYRSSDQALCCAIDFGTSNSAVAAAVSDPNDARLTKIELAPLEEAATSMPTAVFYSDDDGSRRRFGRAAIAAYIDGYEGRLMRSIKSILGSDLMDETTELASGLQIRYVDVVISYLRHLKQMAQMHWQQSIDRVVIGRPVFLSTMTRGVTPRRSRPCSMPHVQRALHASNFSSSRSRLRSTGAPTFWRTMDCIWPARISIEP